MLTVVFYSTNGPAAKYRSREIVATRGDSARVIDAAFWEGDKLKCDKVEIMPDVHKWQRGKILEVFGEKAHEMTYDEEPEIEQELPGRKQLGLMPPREEEGEGAADEPATLKAVHRGGGRWFVMNGEDIVSGPHDKAEAARLAAEGAGGE